MPGIFLTTNIFAHVGGFFILISGGVRHPTHARAKVFDKSYKEW